MPVTDRARRYGISGVDYPVGPVNLSKPLAKRHADLSRLSGGYASADRWEISTGSGLSAGIYTFRVGPYSQAGLRATHRALGEAGVYFQADGVANLSAPVVCLGRRQARTSSSSMVLGPFTVQEGDRLWLVVEYRDYSTLRYQIEVDRVDNENLDGTAVLSSTSSGEITVIRYEYLNGTAVLSSTSSGEITVIRYENLDGTAVLSSTSSGEIAVVAGFGPELTHQFEVLQAETTPTVSEGIGLLELTHQLEVLQAETTPTVSEGIGLLELVHHFEVLSVT